MRKVTLMTKKILVTEDLVQEGIDSLTEHGYEVDKLIDPARRELASAIAPYDALIVHPNTVVDAALLDAAENLKIIGRAGVTVDNIDIEAASERGVIVCNAPNSNVISAAEHTMALLLAAARHIPEASASMHAGHWRRPDFMGGELFGKTLAIFGLGRVGGLVAERAAAFGMNLIGHDPYCSPERALHLGVTLYDDMAPVLAQADFITVHLPRTVGTLGMFGADEFAAMKDGVVLVNAARGGIFNMDALADFVAAGKIAAVAVDSFEAEPCTDSPLHEFENAILTPHLSPMTHEAQRRASTQIAEYVEAGLEGGMVATAVNLSPLPPEVFDAIGPYVHACKMMGSMASQILGHTPKSLKVELAGGLADADPAPLLAAVLDGSLSTGASGPSRRPTPSRWPPSASISVTTASARDAGEYASSVRIVADEVEVAATLFGTEHTPRIISLMGYKIDIAPASSPCVRVGGRPRPHRRHRQHSGRRRGQHHHHADRHQAGGVLRARVHECRGGCVRSGARPLARGHRSAQPVEDHPVAAIDGSDVGL